MAAISASRRPAPRGRNLPRIVLAGRRHSTVEFDLPAASLTPCRPLNIEPGQIATAALNRLAVGCSVGSFHEIRRGLGQFKEVSEACGGLTLRLVHFTARPSSGVLARPCSDIVRSPRACSRCGYSPAPARLAELASRKGGRTPP